MAYACWRLNLFSDRFAIRYSQFPIRRANPALIKVASFFWPMHCSKTTPSCEGGENASLCRRKAESPLLYGSEGSVHGWQEYMQAYAGPRGAEKGVGITRPDYGRVENEIERKAVEIPGWKKIFRDIFKTSFDASSFCPMLWVTIRLWAGAAGVLGEAAH